MTERTSSLLTDLYQLTMLQAYLDQGMADTAVFEFFVRELPPDRNFLMASKAARVRLTGWLQRQLHGAGGCAVGHSHLWHHGPFVHSNP